MNHVKVSVDLLIPVENLDDATVADTVSAILSENLQCSGAIIDWQYHNGFFYAKPYKVEPDYHEGEAFEV